MSHINNKGYLAYQNELQGLRAIAVIAVILAHAKIGLFSGGFIGVDIFFVLSGYLISKILILENQCDGTVNLLNFYSRRIKRLLPSLTLMIVMTTLLSSYLLPKADFLVLTSSWLSALTWTSNFYFALENVDYFATSVSKDIFLHTWSLAVEEQFYLLWPLLFISGTLRIATNSKTSTVGRPSFFKVILILALLSFLAMLYLIKTNPHHAYYLMPSRIWQFCFGAFVAIIHIRSDNPQVLSTTNANLASTAGIIGLTTLGGGIVGLNANLTYPGFWALIPSVGTALIIWSCNQNKTGLVAHILSHPVLVWIGDRSYSLYLWHWPILVLGFILYPEPNLNHLLLFVLCFVLISMLNYRLVEIPFWKGKFSRKSPLKTILIALLATAIAVSLTLKERSNISKKISMANNEMALTINRARSDLPAIYSLGCDTWYSDAEVMPCITNDGNEKSKTIVFLGDSAGGQWIPAILSIYKSPEWRVVILTKSACAIVDEDYYYERIGKEYKVCRQWRDAAIESIEKYNPNTIIVGSSSNYSFSKTQWLEGSQRIFNDLSIISEKVIVLAPTPILSFNAPNCLLDHQTELSEVIHGTSSYKQFCSEENKSNSKLVGQYLTHAMATHPNVKLLNLNDLVCPNNICSSFNKSAEFVYRDSQHLTASFVVSQSEIIEARIKKLTSQ